VLGDPIEREMAMLGEALVRHGARTAAFVAADEDEEKAANAAKEVTLLPPVRCDIPLAEAGHTRFPVDAWEKKGAKGWLIAGSAQCARDVLRDIGTTGPTTTRPAALTLEAGVPLGEVPRGVIVLSASAGIIPVLATKSSEAADEDTRRFMDTFGVRPSWWTALGHDAGALAKGAVAKLPSDTTVEASAIAQRRAQVHNGLAATRVKLWTTDEQGISASRALERNLRIVTWQREKR
jgi:hypothetical protein